jgi:asparagine synthase (glutamine-hydrolysing)
LLGDFAFALWDARQHRLFCARDHLGLKPFYYVHTAASFAFASEIKALFALPWTPRRPNETRVADYLMQMVQDKEATFYDGILRLPPAHTLTVTPAGLRLQPYWGLDPEREIRYASDADYAEAFRERFVEAVRCRLRSSLPVGTFLSGGLDSSSVTCVAGTLMGADDARPLPTFSLVFDDVRQSDERPYIEAVLAQGGLQPHYVYGDHANPLDELDRMLGHVEEPFFTPSLYLGWQLYRAAQVHGIGVMLDGFLGDSAVAHGDRYLTELAATRRWRTLAREMHTIAGLIGGRRKGYPRLLRQYILAPLLLEPMHRTWAALTRPELPASPCSRFINSDFARRIGWMARARAFGENVPRTPLSTRQEQMTDLTSGALPGVFEIVNKATAALGVTLRYPFTDRRLLGFARPPARARRC